MEYRATLEVLKFATPEEVALQCSHSSRLWAKAVQSSELWWTYCQDRYVNAAYFAGFPTPLEAYKSLKSAHFILTVEEEGVVAWYDCINKKRERTLEIPLGTIVVNSQCVLMDDLSVIVVGGGRTGSGKVVKIGRNGEITGLPSLVNARAQFGLIRVQTRIFVFGGEHNQCELSSSEALNLSLTPLRRWVSQGSMISSRADFTPAIHRNRIYLCGGNTTNCEVYDLSTRSFEALSRTLLHFPCAVCALIVSEDLILLTPKMYYFYDIETLARRDKLRPYSAYVSYAMRPVLKHNSLFTLPSFSCNVSSSSKVSFPDRSYFP